MNMNEKECQENYNLIIQSNCFKLHHETCNNFLIQIVSFSTGNLKEIYTSKC